MPSTEVTYFDFGGRAEVTRILLHAAGVDFKDNRFPGKEWPTVKPTTPLGQVPTLKVDDVTYTQSLAMARYAAKLGGYYPEDPLKALAVDEAMDILESTMSSAPRKGNLSDEEFIAKRKEYQESTLVPALKHLEQRIQSNGSKTVSGEFSCADIALYLLVNMIRTGFFDHVDVNVFDAYPSITAAVAGTKEHKTVKDYYASLKK